MHMLLSTTPILDNCTVAAEMLVYRSMHLRIVEEIVSCYQEVWYFRCTSTIEKFLKKTQIS